MKSAKHLTVRVTEKYFAGVSMQLIKYEHCEQEVPSSGCFLNYFVNGLLNSLTKKVCYSFFVNTIHFEETLRQSSENCISL